MNVSYRTPDADGRITPTTRLLKRERELWNAYVGSHPPAWFTTGDVSALTTLVQNEADCEKLRREVKRLPPTVQTRSGFESEHPEYRRLRQLEAHVLKQKKALRLVSQTSKRIDEVVKLEREAGKPPPPWLWRPGPGPHGHYVTPEEHEAEQVAHWSTAL